MNKPSYFLLLVALILLAGVSSCTSPRPPSVAPRLTDSQATAETQALYRNLLRLKETHMLFGHQDTLAYGVLWEKEHDRSDVKDVTGSFAAVSGWDIGGLESDSVKNLDGVEFAFMGEAIKRSYRRGGITTISWHMINPVSGGPYNDTGVKAVTEILPGGVHHAKLTAYLDKFATFNERLVVDGVQVPIIFRPWHEHNGEWFWWGKTRATEEEYIALWRFTVDYLRKQKRQHNLIFAFSPDRSRTQIDTLAEDYFYGYPGDDYVDIIGLDNYWDLGHPANHVAHEIQLQHFTASLAAIAKIAAEKNKVAALTEGGAESIPNAKFWTQVILQGVFADPNAQQIAWILVWRNAFKGGFNERHFYAPYPGHSSADDFVRFKNDQRVMFEDELPDLYR